MAKILILFSIPLLTACGVGMNNGGGGGGSFKLLDTGDAGVYTCENTSFHDHYCATGEHPNLCDC